jgi:hypothetical protein
MLEMMWDEHMSITSLAKAGSLAGKFPTDNLYLKNKG